MPLRGDRLIPHDLREATHSPEVTHDPYLGVPTVGELASADATDGDIHETNRPQLIAGGSFILDTPANVPAIWGRNDEVLWPEGEPLMITGPTGVGKTTLGGQLVAARLGILDQVLGYPVRRGRRVLYLAMDRPKQIARALGRVLRNTDRETLDDRLVVWKGPPPADLARHRGLLLALAEEADADTVVIDGLKDAAVKLSDEETGQGLNKAMQLCIAAGIEVLAYHHQRKGQAGDSKPKSIADVYGSTWLTAGCGSVLLLWGSGGDVVVELSHLKQPAAMVGPLTIAHDHTAGVSRVEAEVDLAKILTEQDLTVSSAAVLLFGDNPGRSQREKARRRLERLVRDGVAVKVEDADTGRYTPVTRAHGFSEPRAPGSIFAGQEGHGRARPRTVERVSAGQEGSRPLTLISPHEPCTPHTDDAVSPGQEGHGSVHGGHAGTAHVSPSLLREGNVPTRPRHTTTTPPTTTPPHERRP
jgi:replicative DNA helicase